QYLSFLYYMFQRLPRSTLFPYTTLFRSRAEENLKVAKFEFKKSPLLTDVEIAEILLHVKDLTKWANEIFAYATNAAVQQGKQWTGFKVVEGRSEERRVGKECRRMSRTAHGKQ